MQRESFKDQFHVASMSIINILRHTPLESAGNLPKHLAQLFEQSKIFVLPEKGKGNVRE